MATTISIRVAGKPSAEQGGNGTNGRDGRFGLRAKLMAGVAILGCAAALTFGVVRTEGATQHQSQTLPPAALLPAGTDDLATTGCIGTAGPFGCQAGQSIAGTDDFTTGCVGAEGLFACPQGQSLAGTNDLAPFGCVQVPGPFACATALPTVTYGTDDFATNWCVGTEGPFACAIAPLPGPANFHSEDH
jgi:hypothetical protein